MGDLAAELQGYLSQHEEEFPGRAQHMQVHVDYWDLVNWHHEVCHLRDALARLRDLPGADKTPEAPKVLHLLHMQNGPFFRIGMRKKV